MTSTDGNTWTVVNSALTNNGAWQSVAYGNGRFVAVANNGTRVITSENGTNWTARTAPAGDYSTVAYGGGRFVVLGYSGTTALYSSDGVVWNATAMPNGGWMDVVYGGGQFVAVSWTGNHIATSPDGMVWTARSVPDSRQWGAITYTGGHYIVVGGGGSGPNRMMVSGDGIEWTPKPIPHEGQSLSTVTWGNDTLVVSGHDLYPDKPQFFIGDCPQGCYMPNARTGAREWFSAPGIYKFCDGEAWRDFANDGTAGDCSVPGQMEWDDAQAVHTMCDGTQRQILRYIENSGPPDLGACNEMGAIDFYPSPPLYKYCDGSGWRPMTGDPCVASPIRAVTNASATETEIRRDGALQNTADGPRFTLSLWFKMKPHASNPETQVLFENTSGRIQLGFYSDHPGDTTYDIWVHGKNSSDTYRARIEAYDIISENVWYHAIASFDTASGQGRLYINDVEVDYDMRNVASGGQVMDIQSGAYMVHFFGWPGGFEGEIADFWYDDSYVDLSVEANRRKFISGGGKPVGLGADGSGPTGAQPLIFFSGDATQWGTNKGRGGTFTQTGKLKNATILQSDPSSIGNVCYRGIVYVGMHPTIAGSRVYTTTVGEGHIPRWSTEAVLTGATSFVDGLANQNLIKKTRNIANYPAMQACDNLTAGGYNDWYLPSIAELDLLYSNLVILPFADPDNPIAVYAGTHNGGQTPSSYDGPLAGSFDTTGSGWYWSSTEGDAANAYDQSFQSGYRDISGNKTNSGNYNVNKVRCIRREPLGDPCQQQNPIPGSICNDGTVYAGRSPDGNVKMYTTVADAGLIPWNNGTLVWGDTPLQNCMTQTPGVAAACRTGKNNTEYLAARHDTSSPYEAASHCRSLDAHGHDDWYLPSQDELHVLFTNRDSIGGFNTQGSGYAGSYWSSSEHSNTSARLQRFSDGFQDNNGKDNGFNVRCVRR